MSILRCSGKTSSPMIAKPSWVPSSLASKCLPIRIDIIVDRAQVALWFMGDHDAKPGETASAEYVGLLLTLTVPARLRRAGKEMRIVFEDGSDSAAPDPSLLRLLIRANAIGDRLLAEA